MTHQETETLTTSPLFVALTRPSMFMGVPMDYFGINFMLCLCGFVLLSSPLALAMMIPLHVVGVIACAIDHNMFGLIQTRLRRDKLPNQSLWGCQSYAPY